MPRRSDLNGFSPQERQTLVNLMLQYLTNDIVVSGHRDINHETEDLFIGHRKYIEGMESFLSSKGAGQFVLLPKWDTASPIPAEFNVVKPQDDGTARPALVNLNPQRMLPSEYKCPGLRQRFVTLRSLRDSIDLWHGGSHTAVGGTMADRSIAPAAPIFWCYHAFLDEIYFDWQNDCKPTNP